MLYCDLNPCLSAGSGLAADISLGAVNGAAAVQYVRNMVQAAPPLKTLVLFVKALLKVCVHAGLDCCDRMTCNLHHAVQDIDAGQDSQQSLVIWVQHQWNLESEKQDHAQHYSWPLHVCRKQDHAQHYSWPLHVCRKQA